MNISTFTDIGTLAGIYIIELFITISRWWWWCWNSVVSILTRLWDGKVRYCVSVPGRDKRFLSCLQHPDLFWGPIQPPIWKVLGTVSQGVMWMGCAAGYLAPYSTKIKMERNCATTLHMACTRTVLHLPLTFYELLCILVDLTIIPRILYCKKV